MRAIYGAFYVVHHVHTFFVLCGKCVMYLRHHETCKERNHKASSYGTSAGVSQNS